MKTDGKITVLLVEDHPVVRAGIRSALAACEQLDVVGEAGTGEEAVTLARSLLPDVMVLDIELPGLDGLDVAELLRAELPKIKIILLSMHENPDYIARATHSGVCGYLLKNTPIEQLVQSVVTVGSGHAVARAAIKPANETVKSAVPTGEINPIRLNERDKRVLALIADGKSNQEIAFVLGVTERTARTSRQALMRKLDIHTVAGLTKYAVARGLVATTRAGESKE